MDTKAFFKQLPDGREYVTLITTKTTFNLIDDVLKSQMVVTSIRVKSDLYEEDSIYKEIRDRKRKIDKELRDYEFKINNK